MYRIKSLYGNKMADVIIFCYRDEYYNAETEEKNIMEMIIGKNRNGAPGIVKAAWVPQYQRISNLEVW